MMAFGDMATTTASTKRAGAVTAGKRAAPVTNLTGVKILPIMPINTMRDAVQLRPGVEGQAIELLETYVEYQAHTDSGVAVTQIPDIKEGDILVVGSTEYEVRFVSGWPATNLTGFLRISLEENKP